MKKILDTLVSQYIRQKYADKKGYIKCYTCEKQIPWKQAHCGHFVSRQHLATRFEEKNVRPQCVGCNIFGGGKVAVFALKLERETPGIVQLLYQQSQKITKYYPYEEEIERYKKLLEDYN